MHSDTNNKESDHPIYNHLVRLWLAAILFILPFQLNISSYLAKWSSKASSIINNLDELTVVIFLLLAIGEFYKNKELPDKMFFFYFSH
jgi:uncharacterized membrane protein